MAGRRADAPSGPRLNGSRGLHRLLWSLKGKHVKELFVLALALAGAASVSACGTPQQQTGTLAGGAIGAGTGALIGSAVSEAARAERLPAA